MRKFVRTIKLTDNLVRLFFSFLVREKYQVPFIEEDEKNFTSYVSNIFLMSGFILDSCEFDSTHQDLVRQLRNQRTTLFLKQMQAKNDMQIIGQKLNQRGIDYVVLKGLALNFDGIYEQGIRASRDIDLLVDIHKLREAYEVLKILGFTYADKRTQDSVTYMYGHHFPVMINQNNTKLELHWRVTSTRYYKSCPMAARMLSSRRISDNNSNIYCPKIEFTLAHILYHGAVHHRMNLGPIFLFDLTAIYLSYDKKWPIDIDLMSTMSLNKEFDLCREIVEVCGNESKFSSKSMSRIKKLFDNSHWLRLSDNSKPPLSMELCTIKSKRSISFSPLLSKVREKRHLYQMSYFSFKLLLLLGYHALRFLKKRF